MEGLKYMIITLDIKIIIIKQEMLEPFQITIPQNLWANTLEFIGQQR